MAQHQFEPMTVGQILDRTFRLYREDFVHFVTIVAVVQVPVGLIMALAASLFQGSAATGTAAALMAGAFLLVSVFLSVVGQSLSRGALVKSVSEVYLGRDVSVGEAYRFVLPKLFTLIWASILVGVVVVIGFLLLIVPGVIFSLWLAVTTMAIIVENNKAVAAMGRSKALTSGNLGKVFGVSFVVFIIALIIGAVFSGCGALVAKVVAANSLTLNFLIKELFSIAAQVLVAPIGATALILLYYDLRIRKEGFDLEMLAKTMGAKEA